MRKPDLSREVEGDCAYFLSACDWRFPLAGGLMIMNEARRKIRVMALDFANGGAVACALALEEITAGGGACPNIMSEHNSVLTSGTDGQKECALPKLARAAWIGGFALAGPQAGSDASNLKTRAWRDGDHDVSMVPGNYSGRNG